jgi:uncharacterized protein (DUF1919 family)
MNLPISFIDESKYEGLNSFREKNAFYPIGLIHDIEIHFLHYQNEEEAKSKWEKRKKRMDKDSLRIKFSIGKDFGTIEHLKIFDALDYQAKLSIGPEPFPGFLHYHFLPDIPHNAVTAFYQVMREVDINRWLSGGYAKKWPKYRKPLQRLISYMLSKV